MATKLVRSPRVRLVLVAVLLIGTAAATLANARQPGKAAALSTTCTLIAPAKISIGHPQEGFAANKLCTGDPLREVSWTARVGSGAPLHELWFAFEDSKIGRVHDSQSLGQWKWTGSVPTDPAAAKAAVDVSFNSPITDVRVESFSSMFVEGPDSVTGKVTLSTLAQRYATSLNKFISYAGATGIMMYKDSPSDPIWKGLKNVASDSNGRYKYIYTPPAGSHRIYQLQIYDATNIWGNYGVVDQ